MRLRQLFFAVAVGSSLSMLVPEVVAQQRPPAGATAGGGQARGSVTAPAMKAKTSDAGSPRSGTPKREPHSAATMTAIAQAESQKNTTAKGKRSGTGTQAGVDRKKVDCEGYAALGVTATDSCGGK